MVKCYLTEVRDWFRLHHNPSIVKDNTKSILWIWPFKRIVEKLPSLLHMIKDECIAFGVPPSDVRCTRQYVEVYIPIEKKSPVPYLDNMVDYRPILGHLRKCVKEKWSGMVVADRNLQSHIIGLLENKDFRLRASIEFAGKNGAPPTLDLLDTIDKIWKLRC